MKKLDLYKQLKSEYVTPRMPALVSTTPARYLTVSGRGDPNGEDFQTAIGSLYGVAFTIKMAKKFAGRDYAVAKLEGLWWGGVRGKLLIDSPIRTWQWKIMIRVPGFVTATDLRRARAALIARGRRPGAVRLEQLREGRVVQLLHVGRYDREHESIGRMREFARARGLRLHGRHHEIYLSDPRRVAPTKLRTILRHPVR
ncbi:MAG TPA: GyrI-like domain-containing protein [Gemmatimonadales bacterium]|nr:GyrI-like domain-containing protein [Gemmatimonadales bacterium]